MLDWFPTDLPDTTAGKWIVFVTVVVGFAVAALSGLASLVRGRADDRRRDVAVDLVLKGRKLVPPTPDSSPEAQGAAINWLNEVVGTTALGKTALRKIRHDAALPRDGRIKHLAWEGRSTRPTSRSLATWRR